MQEESKMPSKAWVSLLWAQYNKLSEPLKEGFVSLAQSMAKETESKGTETNRNTVLQSLKGVKPQ